MRTVLFLLLSWVLGGAMAAAQPIGSQPNMHRAAWNVHPDALTLFLNSQNSLVAPTVSRGRQAPVRFKAAGATVHLDPAQKLLLLVPSAPLVVLWAYRGQQLVFRHEFRAVLPPSPTVKCYLAPCGVTCKPSGYTTYIRTITLRTLPDRDFASALPEDARYRIAQFRVTLLRQHKPVTLATGQVAGLLIQGPQGDLSDLASISQLGDQLQVDVLAVQRMNFRGDIMDVSINQRFMADGPKCPEQ
jgi:hypothetical protein